MGLVPPHGKSGKLLPLLVHPQALRKERLEEAASLPSLKLSSREVSDIVMLATGAFTPLEGFLGKQDYASVLDEMHLQSGVLWPIPITLAASGEEAARLKEEDRIALVDPERDEIMAVMHLEEKYAADKKHEARRIFGTEDDGHPGVKKLYEQGDTYLAGPVEVLSEGVYPSRFPEFARPDQTRRVFAEKGWSTVAAFQTRNPMHRSHEYLTKVALEICDGLLIHPIVGRLKPGDIPAEVRMKCYNVLLENYYPKDRVVLKVYPMEMRYAGPREAVLHAIIRQNFGCSHLIVGRDHAGVGDTYGPFEAQRIFDTLSPDELHIQPLKMDWSFWCNRCEAIVSSRTCPHPEEDHVIISGTELRRMLARGERPPEPFSRPEVIDILLDYFAKKGVGRSDQRKRLDGLATPSRAEREEDA